LIKGVAFFRFNQSKGEKSTGGTDNMYRLVWARKKNWVKKKKTVGRGLPTVKATQKREGPNPRIGGL